MNAFNRPASTLALSQLSTSLAVGAPEREREIKSENVHLGTGCKQRRCQIELEFDDLDSLELLENGELDSLFVGDEYDRGSKDPDDPIDCFDITNRLNSRHRKFGEE